MTFKNILVSYRNFPKLHLHFLKMLFKENLNTLKYTDYGDPILFNKSDYRTSNAIAHRFKVSSEREFVPLKTHQLCSEVKTCFRDYLPQSESTKEFAWKINSKRNHREYLAPSSASIKWNHQFTDNVKISAPVAPLNLIRSRSTDVPPLSIPLREPSVTARIAHDPPIEILHKRFHHTDTEGYSRLSDALVSTTQLDYHLHRNYGAARTNLIVRDEKPFNADSTFFIPGPHSKLINSFPMRSQYRNEIIRDKSKFPQSDFDRIIPYRSNFVEHFGLTTEMTSNYWAFIFFDNFQKFY